MATASQRVVERIPGKDDEHGAGGRFAYVELEARNVDEFEKLRAEAAASPAFVRYDFEGTMGRKIGGDNAVKTEAEAKKNVVKAAAQAAAKKTPTLTAAQKAKLTGQDVEAAGESVPEPVADSSDQAEGAEVAPAPTTSTDASTTTDGEKLSPRDIARAKLLAKKKEA